MVVLVEEAPENYLDVTAPLVGPRARAPPALFYCLRLLANVNAPGARLLPPRSLLHSASTAVPASF